MLLNGQILDDTILEGTARTLTDGIRMAEHFILSLSTADSDKLENDSNEPDDAGPITTNVYILDDDKFEFEVVPPDERLTEGDELVMTVRNLNECTGDIPNALPLAMRARELGDSKLFPAGADLSRAVTFVSCGTETGLSFGHLQDNAVDDGATAGLIEITTETREWPAAVRYRGGHEFDPIVLRVNDNDGAGSYLHAADDAYTLPSAAAMDLDVLANDEYQNGDRSLLTLTATDPPNGSVTVTDAKLRYTPDSGFSGTDTFTYTVSHGSLSDTANVEVTVPGTTAAPVMSFSGTTLSEDDAGLTTTLSNPPTCTAGTDCPTLTWHFVPDRSTADLDDFDMEGDDAGGPARISGSQDYPGIGWAFATFAKPGAAQDLVFVPKLNAEATRQNETVYWVAYVDGEPAGSDTIIITPGSGTSPAITSVVLARETINGADSILVKLGWGRPVAVIGEGAPSVQLEFSPVNDTCPCKYQAATFNREVSTEASPQPVNAGVNTFYDVLTFSFPLSRISASNLALIGAVQLNAGSISLNGAAIKTDELRDVQLGQRGSQPIVLETLNSVIVGVNLAYEDGTHSRPARNVRNTHNGTNPRVAATCGSRQVQRGADETAERGRAPAAGVPRAAAQVHGARSGMRLGELPLLGAAGSEGPRAPGAA